MITITSPDTFKRIPWKNGLGFTTELAINDGANLDNFDWRLSIATVTNDGEFSNFSGYERNLVLIEGNGIELTHDAKTKDTLTQLLDFANFDGGSKTMGSLPNGDIKDFNIITKKSTTNVQVNTYVKSNQFTIKQPTSGLLFGYSLSSDIDIDFNSSQTQPVKVTQGSLAKLNLADLNDVELTLTGANMIVVQITAK